MALLSSNELVEPLCALIGIEPDKLLTLSVHLAVGEPVLIETSFHGEKNQVNQAKGVLPGFEYWRTLATAYHRSCPCDDIGHGECENCRIYRESVNDG